jgi:uncharacterized protein
MANTSFLGSAAFQEAGPYRLMPFRFGHLRNGNVLLSNQSGEFLTLGSSTFNEFVAGRLEVGSPAYFDLKSRNFLTHTSSANTLRVAASQWRTKKAFMEGGPKLHIFVPTLRCNQSCGYCQASRASSVAPGVDMSRENASLAVQLMLSSPAQEITMEFQGGEPLLAFDLVKWMVVETLEGAAKAEKSVNFVICTNLTLMSDAHLAFFKEYGVAVSTSLDGPAEIHNRNRPITGSAAYDLVIRNIQRCHEVLGEGSVSALMTTTAHSLGRSQEIIDEYLKLGLRSIFLRELNPYGFAAKSSKGLGYSTETFIDFYVEALDYILQLNRNGVHFIESHASVLLRKILTPFGAGFVDLQSPTGEGFGVVLYNYDGGVYASDEARMLAEMGDPAFRLGSVADKWTELLFGETMQCIAAAGVAEALPGCCDCVYVPYCGADPIRHYRTQGDLVGHRPSSSFCRKQKAIFDILFELLDSGNPQTMEVFLSWLFPSVANLPRAPWQLQ